MVYLVEAAAAMYVNNGNKVIIKINGGLPNIGLQSELGPASQNTLDAPFGGVSLQLGPQPSLSQCPIS
nr:hypothetical protein CFP56_66100 [Quercus suber]